MEKYKVSIIIPIYNVESYILECLLSVSNQTFQEGLECILVDDCGTDDSMKIAEDFVSLYNGAIKFTILHHEQNLGLSEARNTGIRVAQGEYVYFLDSDDTITPDSMEIMWSYIEKYGKVDLVQGGVFTNNNDITNISPITFPEYTKKQEEIKPFLLQYKGEVVCAQSKLLNTAFLKGNNLYFEKGIIHEDNYWTFFLAKCVTTMAYCTTASYYHRDNPNSITSNINVSKEVVSYRHIILGMCCNIDSFLRGVQKEFILNNLITVLNNKYYKTRADRDELIAALKKVCSFSEGILLSVYLSVKSDFFRNKCLHLLIRNFKLND